MTEYDMEEISGDMVERELELNADLSGHETINVLIAKQGVLVQTIVPTVVDPLGGRIKFYFDGTLLVGDYTLRTQVTWNLDPPLRVTFPNTTPLTLLIRKEPVADS